MCVHFHAQDQDLIYLVFLQIANAVAAYMGHSLTTASSSYNCGMLSRVPNHHYKEFKNMYDEEKIQNWIAGALGLKAAIFCDMEDEYQARSVEGMKEGEVVYYRPHRLMATNDIKKNFLDMQDVAKRKDAIFLVSGRPGVERGPSAEGKTKVSSFGVANRISAFKAKEATGTPTTDSEGQVRVSEPSSNATAGQTETGLQSGEGDIYRVKINTAENRSGCHDEVQTQQGEETMETDAEGNNNMVPVEEANDDSDGNDSYSSNDSETDIDSDGDSDGDSDV